MEAKTLRTSKDPHPGPRDDDPSLEYLAGFFDGEGCVRFTTTPVLSITNTDLGILAAIWRRFGGALKRSKSDDRKPEWRTQYAWWVCGQRAVDAGNELIPYLREKRMQLLTMKTIYKTPKRDRDELIAALSRLKRIDSHHIEKESMI